MNKTILILISASLLSGCASTIDSFYNRHVIEDQMITDETGEQEIGTLAVTAQRRIIVGNLKTGNFCTEPPSEVADSVSSAIASALRANVSADQNVGAELASNFARHVNQLYKRAHTVQLFRDASFHLCVNAVNSAAGDGKNYKSYKKELTQMVTAMLPSLDKEVQHYYDTEKARAETPLNGLKNTVVCNSSATVDGSGDLPAKIVSTSLNCRPITEVSQ